jgi:hypothetical protein
MPKTSHHRHSPATTHTVRQFTQEAYTFRAAGNLGGDLRHPLLHILQVGPTRLTAPLRTVGAGLKPRRRSIKLLRQCRKRVGKIVGHSTVRSRDIGMHFRDKRRMRIIATMHVPMVYRQDRSAISMTINQATRPGMPLHEHDFYCL